MTKVQAIGIGCLYLSGLTVYYHWQYIKSININECTHMEFLFRQYMYEDITTLYSSDYLARFCYTFWFLLCFLFYQLFTLYNRLRVICILNYSITIVTIICQNALPLHQHWYFICLTKLFFFKFNRCLYMYMNI